MSSRLIDELRKLSGARLYAGAEAALIAGVEREFGIVLPREHRAVLEASNGAEGYAGYFRLFGLRAGASIDAAAWNRPEWWSFAWADRCAGYWCFAETAWGDQYAYDRRALAGGEVPQVYLLDAASMTPQVVAACFREFFEREFLRSAAAPYDAMIVQARGRFGPLAVSDHLVYVPSLLLGGKEDLSNIQKMEARSAMICNGDIATQVDAAPMSSVLSKVEPYVDEAGRARLRLVWE